MGEVKERKVRRRRNTKYLFQAIGYIFTCEIFHLPFSLLSFTPVPTSLHPPCDSPHSQTFCGVLSIPSVPSQQMNPLSCIIYPQSKSLRQGLCHCTRFNGEEVLLCQPHPTRLSGFENLTTSPAAFKHLKSRSGISWRLPWDDFRNIKLIQNHRQLHKRCILIISYACVGSLDCACLQSSEFEKSGTFSNLFRYLTNTIWDLSVGLLCVDWINDQWHCIYKLWIKMCSHSGSPLMHIPPHLKKRNDPLLSFILKHIKVEQQKIVFHT